VVSVTLLRFTPGERVPGTHWRGGWVDPRAGLDDVEKRKIVPLSGLELQPLCCLAAIPTAPSLLRWNKCRILIEICEEKRSLARHWSSWDNNIKSVKETGYEGLGSIPVVRYRVGRQAPAKAVIKLGLYKRRGWLLITEWLAASQGLTVRRCSVGSSAVSYSGGSGFKCQPTLLSEVSSSLTNLSPGQW
jgi:hypothetical protein